MRSSRRSLRSLACIESPLTLLMLCAACACATPVGVTRLDRQAAYRELKVNILEDDQPSVFSTRVLERTALAKLYDQQPATALADLHAGLGGPDEQDRLFALSELSFAFAGKNRDPRYYFASAIYAYSFLFPDNPQAAPGAYDPRVTLALDLYDEAIASGLAKPGGDELDLGARQIELPFGPLTIQSEEARFHYGGYSLNHFVALSRFGVRGLRNRYRVEGIGAPLAASVVETSQSNASNWIPSTAKVPVTALVRFDDPRGGISKGAVRGTLELRDPDEARAVAVGNYTVPLASDETAALAYRLEGAPVWDFEIAGFRGSDLGSFGRSGQDTGLMMMEPYRPGRIPVVFIHGTASSPARWAQMGNELMGDPRISSRYQLWLFIYATGNPLAYSAMGLREALNAVHQEFDPDHRDPALDQMVLIGHSQGGLLAKMTVVSSGSRFWDNRMSVPFDQAKLDPQTKELLRRALFVEPLPYVTRVIFICTPHHGSFLASGFLGRIADKFVNLPGALIELGKNLGQVQESSALEPGIRIPTSIDNMDWSNPFLKTLASLPIASGVRAHSIIAVNTDGPVEDGNDGVVEYQSAHIDGVESEFVVHSGHSAQSEPQAIEEVRRILYEHAGIR